ncbi:MAG: phosphoglucosamine mutase [Elusimicrobiota bacterium]
MVDLAIFGTDGIRGKPGEFPLETAILRGLGSAFRKLLQERRLWPGREPLVLLSRDTRESGPRILAAVSQGFASAGFIPRDLGVLPTPALAYLTPAHEALLGCVISASHNPPEYNGVKFFGPNGQKISQDWEKRLQEYLPALPRLKDFCLARKPPPLQVAAARERYQDFLRSQMSVEIDLSGLKAVVDCAQGAAYKILPEVLSRLGVRVIARGVEPNGRNINAASGAMNPAALGRAVVAFKADIGLALDGDGDRLVVADENGVVLAGEWIMASVALERNRLREKGSRALVTTQVSNLALKYYLEKHQIGVLQTKVGDRWVLDKLQEEGLGFGGENSGHFIWADRLPSADGSLGALILLAMMKSRARKASQVFVRFALLNQASLQIPAAPAKPPLETLPDFLAELAQTSKALDHRGRALVRYSGTEPVLRVLLEGSLPKTRLRAMAYSLEKAYRKAVE